MKALSKVLSNTHTIYNMYCFYLVELNTTTRQIQVNEIVYLETNRVSFQRGPRSVGYGRTQTEALSNAQAATESTQNEN